MKIPFDDLPKYENLGWNFTSTDPDNRQFVHVEKSDNMEIDFERIVYTLPIAWEGWEQDTEAWIVETKDRELKLLATNHGELCEESIDFLTEIIDSYENLIEKTQTAISILENK